MQYLIPFSNFVCISRLFNAVLRISHVRLLRKLILNWHGRSLPRDRYIPPAKYSTISSTRKKDIKRYRKLLFSVEGDGWEGSMNVDSELNFGVEDAQRTKSS